MKKRKANEEIEEDTSAPKEKASNKKRSSKSSTDQGIIPFISGFCHPIVMLENLGRNRPA